MKITRIDSKTNFLSIALQPILSSKLWLFLDNSRSLIKVLLRVSAFIYSSEQSWLIIFTPFQYFSSIHFHEFQNYSKLFHLDSFYGFLCFKVNSVFKLRFEHTIHILLMLVFISKLLKLTFWQILFSNLFAYQKN